MAAIALPRTWHDVAWVGAAAFESHGGPMASVSFYKSTTFVSSILTGSTTPASTTAALVIAKSAASRI